jgi:competence protein ComEC
MIKWAPYVFVRLTIYLLAGILAAMYLPFTMAGILPLLITFSVLSATYVMLSLLAKHVWKGKRFSPLFGLLGFSIIFLTGYIITCQRTQAKRADHLSHQPASIQYYSGVIISEVSSTAKSSKAELEVKRIYSQNQWIEASGIILLYLDKKIQQPRYGDKLLIKGRPQRIPAPANPYEFDYRQYLRLQQIHHQHFVKATDVAVYGYHPPYTLIAFSISLRQHADNIFKRLIPSRHEQAIASGLVLGIRDGLDNEIKQAYASAGAMHILAVSGAHVGIVFGILALLLGYLKRLRYGKLLFAVSVLCLLWLYAFVAGLSASALRAVIMASFVIVAESFTRQKSIYNTLALSAFIMLCFDPFLVKDVGFQLSFAAIISIVYITPKISSLLEFDNLVLKKAWQITCASLAAQIGTAPLSLLYFHQFPVYFLLANLAVIPLSIAVLYAGIFTLLFYHIPYVSTACAFVLTKSVWLLNQVTFFTESIPGALVRNISVSAWETCILYLIIISFLLFLHYKKLIYWIIVVGFTCVLSALNLIDIYKQQKQQQLAIYSIANHTALSIIEGTHNFFMADSTLLHQRNTIDFHLSGHWRQAGITQHQFRHFNHPSNRPLAISHFKEYSLLVWQGKTFLFLHHPISNWQFISTLQPEYIVIQNNAVKDLPGKEYFIKHLIIDGNNKSYLAKKLKLQAQQAGIPCHSSREEGAFILIR